MQYESGMWSCSDDYKQRHLHPTVSLTCRASLFYSFFLWVSPQFPVLCVGVYCAPSMSKIAPLSGCTDPSLWWEVVEVSGASVCILKREAEGESQRLSIISYGLSTKQRTKVWLFSHCYDSWQKHLPVCALGCLGLWAKCLCKCSLYVCVCVRVCVLTRRRQTQMHMRFSMEADVANFPRQSYIAHNAVISRVHRLLSLFITRKRNQCHAWLNIHGQY